MCPGQEFTLDWTTLMTLTLTLTGAAAPPRNASLTPALRSPAREAVRAFSPLPDWPLSDLACAMYWQLSACGPLTVAALVEQFGPGAVGAVEVLLGALLVTRPQGNGRRASRHATVQALPVVAAPGEAVVAALHARVVGDAGLASHFARQWGVGEAVALAVLRVLVRSGRASAGVAGAVVAARILPG